MLGARQSVVALTQALIAENRLSLVVGVIRLLLDWRTERALIEELMFHSKESL
jgi:hypothetical protein